MHMKAKVILMQVFIIGCLSFGFVQSLSLDQYFVNMDASSLTSPPYFFSYQPEALLQQYPTANNKPIFRAEVGTSPQYRDLVYNYVNGFAGSAPSPQVNTFQPMNFFQNQFAPQQSAAELPNKVAVQSSPKDQSLAGSTAVATEDKFQSNDYFLPSDLLSLPNNQENQYRKTFEGLKTKKLKSNSRPTSPPPIGGAISNYLLLRNQPKLQSLLEGTSKENKAYFQHIKRETADDSDSVVINAEPFQNINSNEDVAEHKGNDNKDSNQDEGQSDDVQPGIAQSKPAAIALAGLGGVAQASPVGTAVVGPGGVAVSAPSGTAIAGRGAQGALSILTGEEKLKSSKEKNEDSDTE